MARSGILLLCFLASTVSACGAPDATSGCAPLRIMPLGDSITEAEGGHASYRYWLYRELVQRGRVVDFVGSQKGVHGGEPRYADFDADHEGHWGWTTSAVRGDIDAWAERARPDIVLLLLGTNDGASDLAATRANLAAIVERLRAHRPGVAVLLAQVPPVLDPMTGRPWAAVDLLNATLTSLAARLDSPRARVVLVDQWTGFDAMRDTYDGIHPNERGERKIAARWLEVLDALILHAGRGCATG